MEWKMLKKAAEEFVEMPNATIRSIAHKYGISKTNLHELFHTKLVLFDEKLYQKVLDKIKLNLRERAMRGGKASVGKRKIGKLKN